MRVTVNVIREFHKVFGPPESYSERVIDGFDCMFHVVGALESFVRHSFQTSTVDERPMPKDQKVVFRGSSLSDAMQSSSVLTCILLVNHFQCGAVYTFVGCACVSVFVFRSCFVFVK